MFDYPKYRIKEVTSESLSIYYIEKKHTIFDFWDRLRGIMFLEKDDAEAYIRECREADSFYETMKKSRKVTYHEVK